MSFIGTAVFLTSCLKNDPEDLAAFQADIDTEVEIARGVDILYSDSAVLRVQIQGPTMLTYATGNEARQEFPDGLLVDFYDEEAVQTGRLTAKFGVRLDHDREVIVRDSVVWQSNTGEKLETEELIWDEAGKRIYTNKFVVITRPGEIITGYGFEADQNFRRSRIKSVVGRIQVEE